MAGQVIRIPEIPSQAPNHRKNLIFTNKQRKEPPNTTVLKVVEMTPGAVLTRALSSQGKGGATSMGAMSNGYWAHTCPRDTGIWS